jgi:hypothetical protein
LKRSKVKGKKASLVMVYQVIVCPKYFSDFNGIFTNKEKALPFTFTLLPCKAIIKSNEINKQLAAFTDCTLAWCGDVF